MLFSFNSDFLSGESYLSPWTFVLFCWSITVCNGGYFFVGIYFLRLAAVGVVLRPVIGRVFNGWILGLIFAVARWILLSLVPLLAH